MSIETLLDYIGTTNIAESLDDEVLTSLGQQVAENYKRDSESMSDWMKDVEEGNELIKREWSSRSTPWEGASNYKDPSLMQAAVIFGDKASLELLRNKDLVSSEVIGKDDEIKKKAAERVAQSSRIWYITL